MLSSTPRELPRAIRSYSYLCLGENDDADTRFIEFS